MIDLSGQKIDNQTEVPNGAVTDCRLGDEATPARIFVPHNYDPKNGSMNFVVGTGLLTHPNQYDVLGRVGVNNQDLVVVFGHDHRHHRWPIRANADDIVRGTEELGLDHFTAIGHSMGVIAMLLTQEHEGFAERTDKLILVDPPMTSHHTPLDILRIETELSVLALTKPLSAIKAGIHVVSEIIQRPRVIAGQTARLLTGKVNDRVLELSQNFENRSEGGELVVIFGHRDGLVPERASRELASLGIRTLLHTSPDGLAHFAINFGQDLPAAVMAIAKGKKLPKNVVSINHRLKMAA